MVNSLVSKPRILKILAAVVLIIAAAAALWYWQRPETKPTGIAEESVPPATTNTSQEESTVNWSTYANRRGGYRFKYPPDWLTRTCQGNETVVFLAPDEESQAICGSEKGSPIVMGSYKGDQRTDEAAISNYGQGTKVSTATVNGLTGKKISYTHKGDAFVAKGTKYTQYEFFSDGQTYIATHNQKPGTNNYLDIFETIIKTWKFSID